MLLLYMLYTYLVGSKPGEFIYIFYTIMPGASSICVSRSQLPVSSQPAPRFLYILSM